MSFPLWLEAPFLILTEVLFLIHFSLAWLGMNCYEWKGHLIVVRRRIILPDDEVRLPVQMQTDYLEISFRVLNQK